MVTFFTLEESSNFKSLGAFRVDQVNVKDDSLLLRTLEEGLCSIETLWGELIVTERTQEFTHKNVRLKNRATKYIYMQEL